MEDENYIKIRNKSTIYGLIAAFIVMILSFIFIYLDEKSKSNYYNKPPINEFKSPPSSKPLYPKDSCYNTKTFVYKDYDGNLREIKFEYFEIKKRWRITGWFFYDCQFHEIFRYYPIQEKFYWEKNKEM